MPKNDFPLVMPDSEAEITCEEMGMIITGAERLLRNLNIVEVDFTVRSRGKRLVFGLDFSEIYAFLWPERSKSQSRIVTRALLNSENLEFTMLPGTTVEFLRHLKYLASENVANRRKFEMWQSQASRQQILDYFDQPPSRESSASLRPLVQEVTYPPQALKEIEMLNARLSRLSYLQKMQNLIPFDQFLNEYDIEHLNLNLDTFFQVYYSLNLRRPGTPKNNHVDAHNYALAHTLSSAHADRRNSVYYLVTSSPTPYYVFRGTTWNGFPTIVPGADNMSLVRDPLQIFYLAKFAALEQEGGRELLAMIRELKYLIGVWQNNPVYVKFRAGEVRAQSIVKLPRNKRYIETLVKFRSRYLHVLAPVREAHRADSILDENLPRNRAYDTVTGGIELLDEFEAASQRVPARLSMELFDRLTNQTLHALNRFNRNLTQLPRELIAEVDEEGVVVRRPHLKYETRKNKDFGCTDFLAFRTESEELFLIASIYESYFSIMWPVKISLTEFLVAVRYFIASAHNGNGGSMDRPTANKSQNKMFNGINLRLNDELLNSISVPLERVPELNPDEIYEVAQMREIEFIQIATDYGDLSYEFASSGYIHPLVRIVTHLPLKEIITPFVHATSKERVSFPEVDRILARFLRLFT